MAESALPTTFEASLAELEKLVQVLEGASRPLEEQLAAFEKGVRLAKDCFQRLEAAEKRVAQVLEGADGVPVEAPLDAPPNG
jgi:exodeoxyribonuclease VII small subunit